MEFAAGEVDGLEVENPELESAVVVVEVDGVGVKSWEPMGAAMRLMRPPRHESQAGGL